MVGNGGRLVKQAIEAEVSGCMPRGRTKFKWMDGVKKALGYGSFSL